MQLSPKRLLQFFSFLIIIGSVLTLTQGATPWIAVMEGAHERLLSENHLWNPLLDERIPRLIILLSTGASLAVSGAILQSLFQNPLASPSILGVSCGGSLAVTLAFTLNLQLLFPLAIPLSAFAGCMATLILVITLSYRSGGIQMGTLILTGVALSSVLLSIQGVVAYALRDHWQLIQALTEWQNGSTVDLSWKEVHMQLPLTLIGLFGAWHYRTELNLLSLGDEEALVLGVDVARVRWRLFLCTALLTGGAIAAIGAITFFGLIIPHLLRRLSNSDNRTLIPLAIIAGGAILLLLDLFLRHFAVHALSIGNLSALFGGCFFLLLLFGSPMQEPLRS